MQSKIPPPSKTKHDESRKMLALQYHSAKNVKVGEVPVPLVTDPTDAIIKVTATTICGSDLHLYRGLIPGMPKGYILGHESVGIVDDIGPQVTKFKKGDRVVISSIVACGQCEYCKREEWSLCDSTNPNPLLDKLSGDHTSAFFGYSHTFGGLEGCQAEYVRVPIADVNLFPIPSNVSDRQAVLVADGLCTSYHGVHLAEIKPDDNVAIFGCGPIGLGAIMWCQFRGAKRIVAIDVDQQRLDFAKAKFGVDIVNYDKTDPIEEVDKLIPGGPNKIIECVGFRFPDSLLHKIEQTLKLETDAPGIINTAIKMVKKCGLISVIGDYAGYANHFNFGSIFLKQLTLKAGVVYPQTHHKLVFEAMASGKIDATVLLTHDFKLSELKEAYNQFDNHKNGIIKAFVVPDQLFDSRDAKK